MIEPKESKLKPELKVAEDFLTVKDLGSNVIIEHLEEQLKLREMPVEKKLKQDLLKK